MIGLIGFAAASALGGLAPSQGFLLAARGLQGAFAALLAPAALSLLTVTFHEPKERAKAFGVYGCHLRRRRRDRRGCLAGAVHGPSL
jgi:MFS family permease